MTPAKRLLDITLALLIGLILAIPFTVLLLWLLITQGRPLFHVSERMKTPTEPFSLWKLRTMRPSAADSGVSGGDKADRVTPAGRRLRRTRLDEIPQLWNILRGDMSFVGPRPPLRQYVERFPAIYGPVLQSRPGVTGLASLHFHRHEELLLRACNTPQETDAVYVRRCIPRKARLDLIYQARRTICLDLMIVAQTAKKVLPGNR
ncbi:MAG: sugar transferase [Gemmobacter sp.]|nr:sugar transferase [Gemmobacter sp.]